MKILELRILPPIAIGRLGASEIPLEAYDLKVSEDSPLGFRQIVPEKSLEIQKDGTVKRNTPTEIQFKDASSILDKEGKARPVAPFLEVFAITDQQPDVLVPLTLDLLKEAGCSVKDISWNVELGNIKLFRRTFNEADKIEAKVLIEGEKHEAVAVEGHCDNFIKGKTLPLGTIQFIRPNEEFPAIRLRYTPAAGLVYGAKKTRQLDESGKEEADPVYEHAEKAGYDFLLYKEEGDWLGYCEDSNSKNSPEFTNPAMIFAGYDSDDGNKRFSWGYVDDECDGFVEVHLKVNDQVLTARAHTGAGLPLLQIACPFV